MSPHPYPPQYWRHEVSGVLKPVIQAYLSQERPLTIKEVAIFRAHLAQWINSSVWDAHGNEDGLAGLRDMIPSLNSQSADPHMAEQGLECGDRSDMKTNLKIRGFLGRTWQFVETLTVNDIDQALGELGEKHAIMMNAGIIDMVEIEFQDEPNVEERFFRIGINTEGMVAPVEVDPGSFWDQRTERNGVTPDAAASRKEQNDPFS